MIHIPKIRTKRICVQPVELQLGAAIQLCQLPPNRHHEAETFFLRAICPNPEAPTSRHVVDPLLWTLEERTMVVVRYLSEVSDDPDFVVGDGRMSNYFDFASDLVNEQVSLGVFGGADLYLRPLLGIHLEMLESVCQNYGDWVIGMTAMQVTGKDYSAAALLAMTDHDRIEHAQGLIAKLKELPESEAEELFAAVALKSPALRHFFTVTVDKDGGPCFAPMEGAPTTAPARFRVGTAISSTARRLAA